MRLNGQTRGIFLTLYKVIQFTGDEDGEDEEDEEDGDYIKQIERMIWYKKMKLIILEDLILLNHLKKNYFVQHMECMCISKRIFR